MNLRKTLASLILVSLAPWCLAAEFKELVTFGDSLTDMGNRSVGPDKKDVKFRETWVAQLAGPKMMNIPDFKPSGMNGFYFGGTNYAVGGSTSGYASAKGRDANKGQNLTVQISKRYLNPEFNKDGVKKDALHVVRIGTNDLMALAIQPEQIASSWATLDQEAVKVVQDIEGQIQAMASAGVKYVMWGNLSDGSKFPSMVRRVTLLGDMAPVALQAVSNAGKAFNKEMDEAIARLTKANPQLVIIKLDMDAQFNQIAADPGKFGFVSVTEGANDSKHLFSADGLHPTPTGHRVLAEYAFAVISAQQIKTN
ncbi:MAG TPA: SGNH/GDSL hydrolase family protein [Luteolibacter sp.]|nr:SGNH/GDSL hydrolase family protein [Luteolibacter sp.]